MFAISFLFLTTPLAVAPISEEAAVKRIQAHLVIKDVATACSEGRSFLELYPESKPLWEAYIKALARSVNEKELMAAWNVLTGKFEPVRQNRELLEEIAWSIIESGSTSTSPIIRLMVSIGAYYGEDSRGVDVIHKQLSDPNSAVRNATVQLASRLRDAKLCDAIAKMYRQESCWNVRLQLIKALGKMHVKSVKPELTAIISNDKATAEEKSAAVQSLVAMLETADRAEVERLAKSDRAGLRLVACKIVSHFSLKEDLDCIFPLLKDHKGDVRAAALQVFGTMRPSEYLGKPLSKIAEEMLKDPDPTAAITAAWVLTLCDAEKGRQALRPWLSYPNAGVRLQAAAAVASTGKYGLPLAVEVYRETQDPYVGMTLALALINQRVHVNEACQILFSNLLCNHDRWMWKEQGIFRAVAPSNIRETDRLSSQSESENQLVRLELLSVLAVMKYEKAQTAIARFLMQRTWGITTLASALLLTEGDEEALNLVKNLLADARQHIRIQAALILAIWGRDENVISILQEAYGSAPRELKEKILEGLGHIGAQSSIPFLLERMQEPSQMLRICAASALLQCLYH